MDQFGPGVYIKQNNKFRGGRWLFAGEKIKEECKKIKNGDREEKKNAPKRGRSLKNATF